MTTHEKALEAAAKAIRSDIWEREPNPTTERYVADLRQQVKDQAEAAVAAYLSALLLEDAAGLVERLRGPLAISGEHRDEAAALIQSQAAESAAGKARIAELEAAIEHKNAALDAAFAYLEGSNPLNASGGYRNIDLRDKVRTARSVLNGERKG